MNPAPPVTTTTVDRFGHQPRRVRTRNATRLTAPNSCRCTASCAAVRLIRGIIDRRLWRDGHRVHDPRDEVVDAEMAARLESEEPIEPRHQRRLLEVHVVPHRRHLRQSHARAHRVQGATAVGQALDEDEPRAGREQTGDVLYRALLQRPALEVDQAADRERDVERPQGRGIEVERVADLEAQARRAGGRGAGAGDHRFAEIDAERLADERRQQSRRVPGSTPDIHDPIARLEKRLDRLDLEPPLPDVVMGRLGVGQRLILGSCLPELLHLRVVHAYS